MAPPLLTLALLLAAPGGPPGGPGVRAGESAPSPMYAAVALPGRVLLDGGCTTAGVPAVTFDHWRHRALYTCRVCHADLGFALRAGETEVTAAKNEAGLLCGACHDGKTERDGKPIFRACSGWPRADPARGCTRCHTGSSHGAGGGYDAFRSGMPVDVAGDVDWAEATRRGLVQPSDTLDRAQGARARMKMDRDFEIRPLGTWMNGVTFSHRKHVSWIGCELCHPEIFPVTKRGAVKYGMEDLRAGRYCGACHANVAFPLTTCQRCHLGENGRAVR